MILDPLKFHGCPQCGETSHCPCRNCADMNAGRVLWKWIDGEAIACGHCGYTMHADWWMDYDYTEFKRVQEYKTALAYFGRSFA